MGNRKKTLGVQAVERIVQAYKAGVQRNHIRKRFGVSSCKLDKIEALYGLKRANRKRSLLPGETGIPVHRLVCSERTGHRLKSDFQDLVISR